MRDAAQARERGLVRLVATRWPGVDATDLGATPNLMTGLGFAPCGTGIHHYDTLEIVVDHIQAATLSSTFAQNLTPNARSC